MFARALIPPRSMAPRRLVAITRGISSRAASQAQHHSGPEDTLLGGERTKGSAAMVGAQIQRQTHQGKDAANGVSIGAGLYESKTGSGFVAQKVGGSGKSKHAEIYQSA
ncbi:hypothetical protein Cpir12675_005959 [Ceratocystis pirilliformis]|uniref:Uncharacterized protein n=1 Tax=Ceratocystis pirilliformis TaxID=259994 RepID=A0ABR3YM54_9PEZI